MDDLKLKLEKFQTSFKNLTELLASQTSEKTGYHAVPPPCTGTFMPPKPDLVFNTAPTTDWLSDSETEYELKAPQFLPSFVQSSKHVKSPRHSVQAIETTIPATTSAPVVLSLIVVTKEGIGKLVLFAREGHHKQYAPLTHSKPQKHMVPTAVLTQSKPVSNTAVRPVSAALPNITGNPQQALRDKGLIDSRCSRHMTGNMSYLSKFEELNGGYVAFGGNPKGGKITGKGKIKT
nr:hypothetical protein [Tanacetum cinerariifolium]